jgi:hypothetical protein
MPFMESSPLGALAARGARFTYGPVLKRLRARAIRSHFDAEPDWRRQSGERKSGYAPRW